MLDMYNMFSSNSSILKSLSTETKDTTMNPKNVSYADVVKNHSGFLNPGMHPTPLIPKAPRICLSEEAKAKLRAAIKEEPIAEPAVRLGVKSEGQPKSEKTNHKSAKSAKHPQSITNSHQPLVLATASDWVVSGSAMRSAIYDMKKEEKSLSSVR